MASEIKIRLSDDAYQRMVQYARAHDQDIGTAIADYLEQNLPSKKLITANDTAKVKQEVAVFHAMHEELKAHYAGEYVAIYGGQVVDHDTDRLALYTRIERQYPDRFVLMRPVGPDPDREFSFRSLRLQRRA